MGASIAASGFPLAFRTRPEMERSPALRLAGGRDVFVVEARFLEGHQKEAVVTEGAAGASWRMVSDEGGHLKGTDLAPFPLGYFNAGLTADLAGRLVALAAARSLELRGLGIETVTAYAMTGSFFRGDGVGEAGPPRVAADLDADLGPPAAQALLLEALAASPAFAAVRLPLANSFSLTLNGRKRALTSMPEADTAGIADPYLTHARAPSPLAQGDDLPGLIRKTGLTREGDVVPASPGGEGRITREVLGVASFVDPAGVVEVDTALQLPGMSHFTLTTDERPGPRRGPSGLAYLAAGLVFCFMTQLARYVEHQKLDVGDLRIVQRWPLGTDAGRAPAGAEPAETHVFANAGSSPEAVETLIRIAARTCYLHATLAAALTPVATATVGGRAAA